MMDHKIAVAIEHQEGVARSTIDKIDHEIRQANMALLEAVNTIIADVPVYSIDDMEKKMQQAIARKNRLIDLRITWTGEK